MPLNRLLETVPLPAAERDREMAMLTREVCCTHYPDSCVVVVCIVCVVSFHCGHLS